MKMTKMETPIKPNRKARRAKYASQRRQNKKALKSKERALEKIFKSRQMRLFMLGIIWLHGYKYAKQN